MSLQKRRECAKRQDAIGVLARTVFAGSVLALYSQSAHSQTAISPANPPHTKQLPKPQRPGAVLPATVATVPPNTAVTAPTQNVNAAEIQREVALATFGRDPVKFAQFDELQEAGITTAFPGNIDTIFGDAGGWRTWLHDHDMYVQAYTNPIFVYNVLNNTSHNLPTRFNGQVPTLESVGTVIKLDVGLASIGLPNSYVSVGLGAFFNNVPQLNSPSPTFDVRSLYYAQTFFDKAMLIKIGYFPDVLDFAGLFAGGNPVLATGEAGLIPVEAGLALDPGTAPTVEVALYGQQGLYLKGAVQRSISPAGYVADIGYNNYGLKFLERTGARQLYIVESGLKRTAAPDTRQIWVRAGVIYNQSKYTTFQDTTSTNKAVYGLVDYQVLQPDKILAFRGLYLGATAQWSPPEVNFIDQNYEARAYWVGPFARRPTDAINLTFDYNRYSPLLRRVEGAGGRGVSTAAGQASASLAYTAHVYPGVYAVPQASYVDHPYITSTYKDALILGLSLYLLY